MKSPMHPVVQASRLPAIVVQASRLPAIVVQASRLPAVVVQAGGLHHFSCRLSGLHHLQWLRFFCCQLVAGLALVISGQCYAGSVVESQVTRPIGFSFSQEPAVIVTQFFHQGLIAADGRNVAVLTRDGKPVPCRVLQLGGGDYCRLAFQPLGQQRSYEIRYGGQPLPESQRPAWTAKAGLLLETRAYRDCNLSDLGSVRKAFDAAPPIGADFVAEIRHGYNPFSLVDEPFMSRYSGVLRVPSAGTYGFFVSTQDCGFLLIDGQTVASAPGRHPPLRRADPKARSDVKLSAGAHTLEFYHAATGNAATMAVSWIEVPAGSKAKIAPLTSELFLGSAVARAAAGPPTDKDERPLPDFAVQIAGEVPLADRPAPLIGVRFTDTSSKAIAGQGRFAWDFGDGQRSSEANPQHVYLLPGTYTVKLVISRAGDYEASNRVYINRPRVFPLDAPHQLADYLPILRQYDPQLLGGPALLQWLAAMLGHAERLLAPEPGELEAEVARPKAKVAAGITPPKFTRPVTAEAIRRREAERRAEALEYRRLAADAVVAALSSSRWSATDSEILELAQTAGPVVRDALGDALLAGCLWRGAAAKSRSPAAQGQCILEAADIALADLANPAAAKEFLDQSGKALEGLKEGPLASRLARVEADYQAATGNGQAARDGYSRAQSLLASTRTPSEQSAWQGAYSRSAEQFLQSRQFDRAAAELRRWQEEFPADKMSGYLSLLWARYWAGRGLHAQAIQLADQLLGVSPDSPYIDQLLFLAAESELARGRADRALATLHGLVRDYPGSALVEQARGMIERLATARQ